LLIEELLTSINKWILFNNYVDRRITYIN